MRPSPKQHDPDYVADRVGAVRDVGGPLTVSAALFAAVCLAASFTGREEGGAVGAGIAGGGASAGPVLCTDIETGKPAWKGAGIPSRAG